MSIPNILGQTIDDRFLVKSALGAGGFSSVYRAHQIDLNRDVAIKFLHMELLDDPDAIARFEREARIIAGFKHPNIVACYAYGVWLGKLPYLVFELIEGTTLRAEISKQQQIDAGQVREFGQQLCAALAHAHQHGVVHRDVKPENVFITTNRTVKLIDFGLSSSQQRITRTGTLVGTAQYMSPEVSLGERVGPAADIYSLGCVLYECLAGHPPFSSDNPFGLMHQHRTEPIPPLPAAIEQSCPGLNNVLSIAMQKKSADRFDSAAEFADALRDPSKVPAPARTTGTRTSSGYLRPSVVVVWVVALLFILSCASIALTPSTYLGNIAVLGFNALKPSERAGFAMNTTRALVEFGKPEAALVFLNEVVDDTNLSNTERLGLLTNCMKIMRELNYSSTVAQLYTGSVKLIGNLTPNDFNSEADRDNILAALAMDQDVAAKFRFGLRNDEFRLARSRTRDRFLQLKDYGRMANVLVTPFQPDSAIENSCCFLGLLSDLDVERQWQLARTSIKRRLELIGPTNSEPIEVYRAIDNLMELKLEKKAAAGRRIYSLLGRWMASLQNRPSDLLSVLKFAFQDAGRRWDYLELADLYPVLARGIDFSNPDYTPVVPYVELLHGLWLLQEKRLSEAVNVLRPILENCDDETATGYAGFLLGCIATDRKFTAKVDPQMLESLAKIILARKYSTYVFDVGVVHMALCYYYNDHKQYKDAARAVKVAISFASLDKASLPSYARWNAILSQVLEHDNQSKESERVADEALKVATAHGASDSDNCELLCFKAYHLAKRHDPAWKALQARAEVGSKQTNNAETIEMVFRTRSYCEAVDKN